MLCVNVTVRRIILYMLTKLNRSILTNKLMIMKNNKIATYIVTSKYSIHGECCCNDKI